VAAAILLLGTAIASWLSALIIAVVLFAIAGVLALTGKEQVQKGTPAKPEQAIDSSNEDVRYVRDHARKGRS